jgi:hypothetical protein
MRITLSGLLLFLSFTAKCITYTTISDGDWNNNSTWDANGKPGTFFGASDQVIVNHDVIFNQNVGFAGSLTVNASGSLVGLSRNLSLNNGASIVANGVTGFNNLTLNSTSTGTFSEALTVDNNLVIGNNSTFVTNETLTVNNNFTNNGGTVTANEVVTIDGNLTNSGEMTFNEETTIGGNFNNNNGTGDVTINDSFTVGGNFQNNSGANLTITSGSEMTVDGSMTNNSGSTLTNSGTINSKGDFTNNGGTVQNDGVHFVDGDFTQNGGTYTNDGVLIANDGFRVNGGGTVDGSGIIRADDVVNFGTISGTNDICGLDDSTPSTTTGNSPSGTTTNCEQSASAALPITLLYFNVKLVESNLTFKWKTLSEINNDYFEVLFSSDGVNFITLLKEQGAGNSYAPLVYSKSIKVLNQNTTGYYSLKQTDFDGRNTTSEAIYFKEGFTSGSLLELFPNPNNGEQLFVNLKESDDSNISYKIYDSHGTLIFNKELSLEDFNGQKIELLQGKRLERGLYYLHINYGISVEKISFIVI